MVNCRFQISSNNKINTYNSKENAKNCLLDIFSLKNKKEKIKTKIGDVNNPAPASAIGIIGITEKNNIIEMTLKNVRKTIANQFFIHR